MTGFTAPTDAEGATTTSQATGLVDFIAKRSEKERIKLFEEFFIPDNAADVLKDTWPDSAPQLDAVAGVIARDGWESALKMFEAQRLEAKRQWQRITGAGVYSTSKAVSWTPADWNHALSGMTEEEAQIKAEDARDALAALGNEIAVTENERAKAIHARDVEIPALELEFEASRQATKEVNVTYCKVLAEKEACKNAGMKARRAMDALQKTVDAKPDALCPHCQGELSVRLSTSGKSVEKFAKLDEAAMKEAHLRLEEAADNLEAITLEYRSKSELLKKIEKELEDMGKQSYALRMKLEDKRAAAELADRNIGEDDAHAKSQAAEDVQNAKRDMAAIQKMKESAKAHEAVVELDAVCKLLGPKGARAGIMHDAVKKINSRLSNICSAAGWPSIHMTKAYELQCKGRPIQLCSESERLVCQYAMQMALGIITKAEWIVFDRADTLRGSMWEGLVKVCQSFASKAKWPVRIVVCGTELPMPDGWRVISL